jgi:hypothetical protein
MSTLTHRLIGSAVFDRDTYEEVEADPSATVQAFAIVVLSSLATGIGATGFSATGRGDGVWGSVFLLSAAAVVGWAAWAVLTFEIGGRLWPEVQTRVNVNELLRTIGFAATPGLLRVLGVWPALTLPVFALTAVWMLIAMIVAVRQALDYTSTAHAIGVCVIGWLLIGIVLVAIGLWVTPAVIAWR